MRRYHYNKHHSLFFYIAWIITILSCIVLGIGIEIKSTGMIISSICLGVICAITTLCVGSEEED